MSLNTETSLLSQVDGSASWKCGHTSIICSVSGPMESKRRNELPTLATLELVVRPAISLSSTREALIKDRLYSVLSAVILRQLHPRSLIQIVLQILEPGEDLQFNILELATCINAATLALIDAGIPLRATVAATAVAITQSGEYIVDPTREQLNEPETESTHVFAYMIRSDNKATDLILVESLGSFTQEQLLSGIQMAAEHCEKVSLDIRATVSNKVKRDFIWTE
ncbi:hypothetical protein NADFUDRAFT_83583 [Nadsonia fulvescens var. elongata DSM 6958]|uniref:Exoribonuclease phosphorolytic domain-containing protein n=1 Tax=Nadsonia fulvescens var. elongata DSM 6958 TaxID=857566 RepID=A0A1E3PGY4_9ASCO|nr:hypothetical protein NADFUDRAFT_83583 [Nadsonia fulvescens var. elongata DSM 6958]